MVEFFAQIIRYVSGDSSRSNEIYRGKTNPLLADSPRTPLIPQSGRTAKVCAQPRHSG